MENQRGFIPLLVIVVTSIVVVSVGAGVILHKQGKLAPLVANISEVFKTSEDITSEELQIEKEPEMSQRETEQEEKLKEVELEIKESEQEVEETEKLRLLAETEKAKAEAEKARLEAERARAEAERLKEETEAKRLAELEKQKEEEARKAAKEETWRKAEEEKQLALENEEYLYLKDDLNYYYSIIVKLEKALDQEIRQCEVEREGIVTTHLREVEDLRSIYLSAVLDNYEEYLREYSKGLWANATWLKGYKENIEYYLNQYVIYLRRTDEDAQASLDRISNDYNYYVLSPIAEDLKNYKAKLQNYGSLIQELSQEEKRKELNSLLSQANSAIQSAEGELNNLNQLSSSPLVPSTNVNLEIEKATNEMKRLTQGLGSGYEDFKVCFWFGGYDPIWKPNSGGKICVSKVGSACYILEGKETCI